MIPLHTLAIFMVAALSLNLMPGPDMMYVAARSLGGGRSAGVVSAFGIAAGTLVHIAVVAAGLSTILRSDPAAYTAIRVAGGLYLMYLGGRGLFPRATRLADFARESPRKVFWQGVLTNLLNPKVALFFLAFLPQFATPSGGSIVLQLIVLGLAFNTSGTVVNVIVAYASGSAATWFTPANAQALSRASGFLLLALGASLVASALL